eukprot:TRINITY_DN66427_c0_g1_i1.p1 TRINITY_DN66427_c0_g1~~TRINITY_DN66427_c0_g1_i1.p1  ORF type:complete len:167 (-),score=17.16 TRINITY_DN66427_c0_g1_i1:8-508(-)
MEAGHSRPNMVQVACPFLLVLQTHTRIKAGTLASLLSTSVPSLAAVSEKLSPPAVARFRCPVLTALASLTLSQQVTWTPPEDPDAQRSTKRRRLGSKRRPDWLYIRYSISPNAAQSASAPYQYDGCSIIMQQDLIPKVCKSGHCSARHAVLQTEISTIFVESACGV